MPSLENDNFLKACLRKETDHTPVWFMRQAGRYLESYQKIRAQHDVLTICKTPELSAKVAVDAAQQLGVDAAIIFADIMLPLEPMGVRLGIVEDVGPVIENPIRNNDDVAKLRDLRPETDVPFVLDSIRVTKGLLDDRIPLIGFSGAPFTLASYMIEGGPSRDFTTTKKLMYREPSVWHALMNVLSKMVVAYLDSQIRAGTDVVQLFDSWSGCLSPRDYEEFVQPYNRKIFDAIGERGVPRIHFAVGTAGILGTIKDGGGDVFSIDWRISIDEAWSVIGDAAIQGNLEPAVLLGKPELIDARARDILARVRGRPGHVFNLGHGVLRETPPEQLKRLVDLVHRETRKKR